MIWRTFTTKTWMGCMAAELLQGVQSIWKSVVFFSKVVVHVVWNPVVVLRTMWKAGTTQVPFTQRGEQQVSDACCQHQESETECGSVRRDGVHIRLSSVVLWQCWRILTRSDHERMLVMTGVPSGNWWVVTSFEEVDYLHVSPTSVIADPAMTHRLLKRFDTYGHVLLAVFHAHPGSGRESVMESSADREAHARYEQAGYDVLTGIINREGFLRVFTPSDDYSLSIYGQGVEDLSHGFYKLHVA